jgi:glycosyltransferase involved in cell wall biosynthesis
MKILLIDAKPIVAAELAAHGDVEVIGLWEERIALPPFVHDSGLGIMRYVAGPKLNPRAIWQVRRILQRERPDIVHAWFGRALAHSAFAASGLRQRPKIASMRGIIGPLRRRNPGDWVTYWHPLVDAHACESEAVRRSLVASGIPADRCWVTYNCIKERTLPGPGRAGLRQFEIPDDAFVVGTVAAMRPVKGVDLLLKAAIQCADLSNVYFLLIGRVLDPAIHALAAEPSIRDRVRLVGHRSDAAQLISGADLLAMPSRSEGIAHALLEGMHQGVCPVVTDVGGLKEVVRHQQDGLVVPPEDVAALAGAIRTLHSDRPLVAKLAAAAKRRVAETFTAAEVAARCHAMYRHLLTARRLRAAA